MTSPTAHAQLEGDLAPLQPLVDALLTRHRAGISNIVLYGSCLRSKRFDDGLVDLYLIVDSYRDFYGVGWLAVANWLLPPNVFYLETSHGPLRLRCKYTVISSAGFARGAHRWFESYIWGRFTQPCEILYSADSATHQALQENLLACSRRFLHAVLPAVAAQGSVADLWRDGLRMSYGSELRAEGSGRAGDLVSSDLSFYRDRLLAVSSDLRYRLHISGAADAARYHASVPALQRARARVAWPLRRLAGKLLSTLRVSKALFTFEGGLDYLVWKLERHSGQTILLPERVRRFPLLFVWGFVFRLYRRGVFR